MGDTDLISQQEARDAVAASHRAFLSIAKFDQHRIDEICGAMSAAALSESARLGQLAQ